ncbi:RNA polymerase sigma factor [Sphingobacterium composti Ten et al. 2007 non Yoo et al. 2007]|uniref:RNA polymerase sigma factor n=1 Tax=Sphingobacterium composti TaxID=363260 RepID=UPI001356E18B|nr:RNA polymerase sigma factor [Sphingobacterium composti Ten et al. 2007 non Yoo et al. 2007]
MNKNNEIEFARLLEQHQNILHKICKLYTYDIDSHKDLFQEMVIQIWKAYPNFKGEAKFTTWAYRIGLNTAISLYRSSKHRITTVNWDISLENITYEDYNSEEEQQLQQIYKAVKQLSDIEKALIYMYLEDKDYAEIAETLGISEVNARVKMNRIKTKIKNIIAQQGGNK